MILEEIDGDVKVFIKTGTGSTELTVGQEINPAEAAAIYVVGVGKATVRVDSNCTYELKGKVWEEPPVVPVPEPEITETAPVFQPAPEPVETPAETPAEEPAKK